MYQKNPLFESLYPKDIRIQQLKAHIAHLDKQLKDPKNASDIKWKMTLVSAKRKAESVLAKLLKSKR